DQVQALASGVAAHPEQRHPELRRGRAGESEARAGQGRVQIENLERLLRRVQIVVRRPRAFSPLLEMPGQHHGIRFATLLEPLPPPEGPRAAGPRGSTSHPPPPGAARGEPHPRARRETGSSTSPPAPPAPLASRATRSPSSSSSTAPPGPPH